MSEYVLLNQDRYPFSRYIKLKSTIDLKYVFFTKSADSYSAFMNITVRD